MTTPIEKCVVYYIKVTRPGIRKRILWLFGNIVCGAIGAQPPRCYELLLAVCVTTKPINRDIVEICHDVIEICRDTTEIGHDTITTNHIKDNGWRCNYNIV